MTWTDAQVAAYEELDKAITNCIDAFESFDDSAMIAGYIVIVTGASWLKGSDLYEDDDDDEGMVSQLASFPRRGQHPLFTRGIVERFIDIRRE